MPNELDEAKKSAIQKNVDWIWTLAGNSPPAQARVWLHPVPIGSDGEFTSIRGWIGAETCGNYGILYSLADKRNVGIKWLIAAQAHNDAVMNDFANFPDYTIDYAISKYKSNALAEFAMGPTLSSVLQIKNLLKEKLGGHNPGSFPEPPEDPEARGGGAQGHRN